MGSEMCIRDRPHPLLKIRRRPISRLDWLLPLLISLFYGGWCTASPLFGCYGLRYGLSGGDAWRIVGYVQTMRLDYLLAMALEA